MCSTVPWLTSGGYVQHGTQVQITQCVGKKTWDFFLNKLMDVSYIIKEKITDFEKPIAYL